jgi:hypothetical protein
MTNYIAAVYLRMHSATTGGLTTFYSSLVSTHQLFLANLLVSRIADEDKRWSALANVSLAITKYESEESSGEKKKAKRNSERSIQHRERKSEKEEAKPED